MSIMCDKCGAKLTPSSEVWMYVTASECYCPSCWAKKERADKPSVTNEPPVLNCRECANKGRCAGVAAMCVGYRPAHTCGECDRWMRLSLRCEANVIAGARFSSDGACSAFKPKRGEEFLYRQNPDQPKRSCRNCGKADECSIVSCTHWVETIADPPGERICAEGESCGCTSCSGKPLCWRPKPTDPPKTCGNCGQWCEFKETHEGQAVGHCSSPGRGWITFARQGKQCVDWTPKVGQK